jgi:hypothetical protein
MNEIVLSKSQDAACDAFRRFLQEDDEREFLLSGSAGTGKSFLVKYLVDITADEYRLIRLINPAATRYNFQFAATTNKAAGVLTGLNRKEKALTIHKTLGLVVWKNFKTGESKLKQSRKAKNLNETILVIDEASMINRELLDIIRETTKGMRNCKILYVGDKYQLPPVKEDPCSLFDGLKERHYLTEIQRQALDSPIIGYAHHFREILDDPDLPWPKVPHDGENIIQYSSREEFEAAIKETFHKAEHSPDLDVANVKALAWTNDTVRGYSQMIRNHLGYLDDFCLGETVQSNHALKHPEGSQMLAATDSYWTIDGITHAIDDDIEGYQLTLVPHDLEYEPFRIFQPKSWVQAGRLKKEYAKNKQWPQMFRIEESWADMRPVYAQTVHKSQGSTYDEVFIDVGDLGRNGKWYEVARLMYVAITRARFRVHLFGSLPERNKIKRETAMEVFSNAAKETDPWACTQSKPIDKSSSESLKDILREAL